MGKVALFTIPKIEPALPWFPTEAEIELHGREAIDDLRNIREFSRQSDNRIREQVAILGSVLGLNYLNELCPDCALKEIIQLCERPDVNAVLTAYGRGKAAADRKAS
jgi:hypothetical protein